MTNKKLNSRDDLYEIESDFAQMLDDFYIKYKQKMQYKGPHNLGVMKESIKTFISLKFDLLSRYIDMIINDDEGEKK